jgi:hypothetical protein
MLLWLKMGPRFRGDDRTRGDDGIREDDGTRTDADAFVSGRVCDTAPCDTRRTRSRANAFTINVIAKSTKPTAISAERCASLDASLNSLAMSDAIVYPGASSEDESSWRLPMSIVTAMVSPSARPRPRITPPIIPDRA